MENWRKKKRSQEKLFSYKQNWLTFFFSSPFKEMLIKCAAANSTNFISKLNVCSIFNKSLDGFHRRQVWCWAVFAASVMYAFYFMFDFFSFFVFFISTRLLFISLRSIRSFIDFSGIPEPCILPWSRRFPKCVWGMRDETKQSPRVEHAKTLALARENHN